MTKKAKGTRRRPKARKGKAHPRGEKAGQKDEEKETLGGEILEYLESLPRKVAKLKWVILPRPKRYYEFLYSKKNFLIILVAALVTYLLARDMAEDTRRVLAIFVFVAGSWMLEVFPIYITSLMIPVALTVFGIYHPTEAFQPFAHPVVFLLIGGLVLGQSIRKHRLDKRLAIAVLKYSKGKIDRIVLLLMATTAFLSMWMSNTVATAVLLPVVLTILAAIPAVYVNFKRKILLGMTMSTTLGGMAMLTGSTPNMIAAAALEPYQAFGYSQWAYYGVPIVVLSLIATFYILKWRYPSPDVTLEIDDIIQQDKTLGPMNKHQKRVIFIFALTIFLWFAGSQVEVWLGLPPSVSSAAIVSILSVLIMFGGGLLDMNDVKSVQWEIMFLVGGGILLGEAMISSGLAAGMGSFLASTSSIIPTVLIALLFIVLSIAMTNFISNTATAAILVPIAIETARVLSMNPVPFAMGVGLGASIAFLTPVGTPSTAMVYATGLLPKGFLLKNALLVSMVIIFIILVLVWFLPVPV